MLIYVDTSAVLKRVFEENESDALGRAIDQAVADGDRLISSTLTRVELARGIRRRLDFEPRDRLTSAFELATGDIAFAPMSSPIVESARVIGPPALRSLDAIHLATAIAVGAGEVWTYDDRLAAASEEMGIVARMPS
ncbi:MULTISPECIES: type II toxin-antitoxin system VapC family toxin [unclassified Microbacterium]|uniref:type II toxin-antitoxin system VapC family toxin n=1 Tax=unclassified Microbacterium TaxID=2609290 RepID=UPI001D337FFF|nr:MULTISPECIES: type II toxin-antitoxin system VapC family toxin [unclassified Microbacterium]CAH0152272.1 Ribonuclease VapC47 [Microbacterium sp. Bi121]HWK78657.1 type II toxin-antitoxin system VapC family toxin [Microbacterium sp.]